MRISTSLILAIAFYSCAQASQYEGNITVVRGETVKFAESTLKKNYSLVYSDDSVQTSVSLLKKNDFISFEGSKSPTKPALRVDSINYVGLSDLLGLWAGDDNYCYNFSTFTDLSIYPKTISCAKPPTASSPRSFGYTINPADSGWFMLLTDNKAQYTADLKMINKKSAELSLYDVNNGNLLRLIKLTK